MGKLIVIEGGDGAGKGTQTELAFSALKNFGEITMFDFPRYGHSVAANIVGQALRGDFGDFRNLDPHISSLPYMIDRAGAREDILAGLAKGNVICNRYTPSNVMYQSAKYDDPNQQDAMIKDLETLEYDELKLPRPDIVLYLHVPAYISKELVLIKDARAYLGTERRVVDQHEADQAYQHAIILRFLKTVEERDTWHRIECVPNYELLSVTPIHEMVMEKIKAIL
jgi:dTMP kinase